MERYLFLLFLLIYGCHHTVQPSASPSDANEIAVKTLLSPEIPRTIQIEHEGKSIEFAVSTVTPSEVTPSESQERTYLQLEADAPVTVDGVMEMAGDIIDSFITQRYFAWLQLRVKTSESTTIKILCIATGDESTTQSSDVKNMTPYYTDITVEEE